MKQDPSVKRPLLTIAIPTFNRCELLRLTLDSILPQAARCADDVEMVVSDNCSTDSTWEMLQGYAAKHPFLRIVRQETNIGPDPNFRFCLEQAGGRYFWLYGDDDLLGEGVVQAVLASLRRDEPDIVFLEHKWFVGTPDRPFEVTGETMTFSDPTRFFRHVGPLVSFISSMVVRNEGIKPSDLDGLTGSYLIQFAWVLPKIRQGSRMIVLTGVNLLARGSNGRDYAVLNTFGTNIQSTVRRCRSLGLLDQGQSRLVLRIFLGDYLPYAMIADRSAGLDKSFTPRDFEKAYEGFPVLGRLSYCAVRYASVKLARIPLALHRRLLHLVG